jgi:hypothetical protein
MYSDMKLNAPGRNHSVVHIQQGYIDIVYQINCLFKNRLAT